MSLHQIFFYLTIILLPTQLGLHTWPDWTLVVGRRIDYLSPTLYITDITMLLMLLMWINFPHKHLFKTLVKFFRSNILWIGLYTIFIGINSIASSSHVITVIQWVRISLLVLFAWYIKKTKPSVKSITEFLTVPLLYSSLLALMQFVAQRSIGGIFWYLGERTFDITTPGIARVDWCWITSGSCQELLRPYATFPHPNVLAGFLVFGVLLVLWQFLYCSTIVKWQRVIYGVSLCLSILSLIITFSRSTWIATIIGASILFGIRYKKSLIQIIGYVAFGISICCAIAFPYFTSLFWASESVYIRQELNSAAFTLWKTYPLFGAGLHTFLIHLPTLVSTKYLFFIQPPHNIFVLLLCELGLFGCVPIWYLLVRYIRFLVRHTNILPIVCVGIYLLLGSIDHYFITLQQGQLLTVLIFTLGFLSN